MQIFASGSRDAVKVVPGLQELMKRLPEITTAPEFTGFITNTIIALQGHISRLLAQPNNEWAIYANVRCQCMDCVPVRTFFESANYENISLMFRAAGTFFAGSSVHNIPPQSCWSPTQPRRKFLFWRPSKRKTIGHYYGQIYEPAEFGDYQDLQRI